MLVCALIFFPFLVGIWAQPPSSKCFSAKICFEKAARAFVPVGMIPPPDGSDRAFVFEKAGIIFQYKNETPTIYLNLSTKLTTLSESGLLGFAFHPEYATNKKFYVYYSPLEKVFPSANYSQRVSEFQENPATGLGDPSSERIILEMEDPHPAHNGGELLFDASGYLLITTGDGGGPMDPYGNGQNTTSFLGKILRIDVDTASLTKNYSIPLNNPFVNNPSFLPEIYAYGLRNPWRATYDARSNSLIVADVGQDLYEEVDLITPGGNYGWRNYEGPLCHNASFCSQMNQPLPHGIGGCIIGGKVSRGCNYKKQSCANIGAMDMYSGLLRIIEMTKKANKCKKTTSFPPSLPY